MTFRGKIVPGLVVALIAAAAIYGEWHGLPSHSPKPEQGAQGNAASASDANPPPPVQQAPAPRRAISRGGIQPSQIEANSGNDQKQDVNAGGLEAKPPADYTPWLVGFTALLAGAAFWQVAITRNSAQRQLRAYIFVKATTAVVANGKTRCEAVVKNSGQTPAYSVRDRVEVWIDTYPDAASPPVLSSGDNEHPICIGPTGEVVVWNDVDVSPADLKEIRAERKAVWMIAEVTYVDTFGKKWKTEVKTFTTGRDIDGEDRQMNTKNYQAT